MSQHHIPEEKLVEWREQGLLASSLVTGPPYKLHDLVSWEQYLEEVAWWSRWTGVPM